MVAYLTGGPDDEYWDQGRQVVEWWQEHSDEF
jgi:hypothetical protein